MKIIDLNNLNTYTSAQKKRFADNLSIDSISDLKELGFTTKESMRLNGTLIDSYTPNKIINVNGIIITDESIASGFTVKSKYLRTNISNYMLNHANTFEINIKFLYTDNNVSARHRYLLSTVRSGWPPLEWVLDIDGYGFFNSFQNGSYSNSRTMGYQLAYTLASNTWYIANMNYNGDTYTLSLLNEDYEPILSKVIGTHASFGKITVTNNSWVCIGNDPVTQSYNYYNTFDLSECWFKLDGVLTSNWN